MKITIKKEVFKKFHPKFRIGFIYVQHLENQKLKESQHLLKEIEDMLYLLFRKDTIKTHHLISPWTAIQEEYGKKARHYQTSLEKLLTKVIKKKKIRSNSTIVNLVNYLSLKHLLPATIDDFDRIKDSLTFQLATGKEKLTSLKKLQKNALYYRDERHILATKLDYWRARYTKPTENTLTYLIHFEALPPLTDQQLKAVLREAQQLIETFCGVKTKTFILDKHKNTATI